jgi:hypothetical protein
MTLLTVVIINHVIYLLDCKFIVNFNVFMDDLGLSNLKFFIHLL